MIAVPSLIDLTGQTFGRVTVLGRSDADYVSPGGQRHTRWDVRCTCGQTKTIPGAQLRSGESTSCGCYGDEVRAANGRALGRANTKELVTYNSAHMRLIRARGPARTHLCVDCGKTAQSWSYQHDDPEELVEPHVLKSGLTIQLRYSLNQDHYVARCKSCHVVFDNNHRINGAES